MTQGHGMQVEVIDYAEGLDPNGDLSADELTAAHARYCELLEEAIVERFPAALVRVTRMNGAGYDQVNVYDAEPAGLDEQDVRAAIDAVRNDVFNRSPWLVEAAL